MKRSKSAAQGDIIANRYGVSGWNRADFIFKGAFIGAASAVLGGLAGGTVGAYIGGGAGAFLGGATASGVGSALYGGSEKDIIKASLIGGALGWGTYQLQMAGAYQSYREAGGKWSYKQFRKISAASQRSFARGRERGGWITADDVILDPSGSGGRATNTPSAKPEGAIDRFHTHPNWGKGWIESHSGGVPIGNPSGDMELTYYAQKVPSYVVGRQNVYLYTPTMYSSGNYTPINLGLTIFRYPYYTFYFGN